LPYLFAYFYIWEKTEISTGIAIPPKQWNSRKGVVKGLSKSAREMNKQLQQYYRLKLF
jgi:hypothetical protein